MSTSRTESQQPTSRRRSNTAQSIPRNAPVLPPLKVDDSKVLVSWVHDAKESPLVIFNQAHWPGVLEGDVIRVTSANVVEESGFLFVVLKDDVRARQQLQVCPSSIYICICLMICVVLDISSQTSSGYL